MHDDRLYFYTLKGIIIHIWIDGVGKTWFL